MNTKDRKHSGRIFPKFNKGVSQKILDKDGVPVEPLWDDWRDKRDGFRNHVCKKCGERLSWNNNGEFCVKHKGLAKLSKTRKRIKL